MENSKLAEKLQNKIYQKMSAEEKLKITFRFFLLGKKLNKLNDRRKATSQNRKNFNQT
jgi:hypothetical protein